MSDTTRTALDRAIAQCAEHSPHTVPLLEAARHGVICLAALTPTGTAPLRQLGRSRLPAIVLVGDDGGGGSDTGPSGWAATRSLTRWARLAVLHAGPGRVLEYRQAVLTAVQVRKLVLVECGTAHLAAWQAVFSAAGVPTVSVVPSDGLHPSTIARRTVH